MLHGRSGRLVARLALGALLAAGSCAVAAPAHAASGTGDCGHVYIGPHVEPGDAASSYFDLTDAPGGIARASLLVANPGHDACTVRLAPASGRTATNSGDTYVATAAGHACAGTACWVHGLPDAVEVPGGTRTVVPVTITVPAGTGAGQYLAGIVGSPVATTSASAGGGDVRVRVATRVAVGVAVHVPGTLRPHLTIPSVSVTAVGPGSRAVQVEEHNDGNTWEHPHGTLSVRVGERTVRLPLTSSTVLAGDRAKLSVGADTVAAGTYPAHAELRYGSGRVAAWAGSLTFAAPATATEQGSKVVVTTEVVPAWVGPLLGATGGLLLVVVVLAVVLLRRRRGTAPAGDG